MIEQKVVLFAITLSLIGITSLYFLSEKVSSPTFPIEEIKTLTEGDPVSAVGTVIDVNKKEKVTLLTLKDDSSSIIIPIFSTKFGSFTVGKQIKVSGKVGIYNEEFQILPSKISPITKSNKEFVKINDIDESWQYRNVHLTGKILSSKSFYSSQLITLQDQTGEIPIFTRRPLELWKGDFIEAEGMVNLYKGKLQVTASSINRI